MCRRLLNDLAALVYPPTCAVCRAAIDEPAELRPGWLCVACRAGVDELAAAPACEHCALPIATAGSPCTRCFGESLPPFERIVALGLFHDPLRQLIHHAKFHGQWVVAERLADRLLEEARVRKLLDGADVLVAVPLHWRRQLSRGYNQSQVLAAALARRCGLRAARPVVRVERTPPQTTIKARQARAENVRHAFRLRPGVGRAIGGRRVVVIDDVMTTGSTLRTVGRVLKIAKPASLAALVVSVADPRGRDFEEI